MSDNWIVQNLENSLMTWNEKLSEIWLLLTESPTTFKEGAIWEVIVNIHGALQAIGLALLVLFFISGVVKTCGNLDSVSTLPSEIITAIEECGFLESVPLWAVRRIGGLFITVLSFIMIMSVYGRFFKIYMYTAIAPIPLSTAAGEPTQSVAKSFVKPYCGVCLEGAVIILACVIFSVFASSPPEVAVGVSAVTQVWKYLGELIFNMLVLVGTVKMSDHVIKDMMGL